MTDTIPEAVIEAMAEEISFSGCLYCENDKFVELRAALKAAEQAGWKLVPVEPTEAMASAGENEIIKQHARAGIPLEELARNGDPRGYCGAKEIHRAMIAASPEVG